RGYEWDGTARLEGRIVPVGNAGPAPATWRGSGLGAGMGEKGLGHVLGKEEEASNHVSPAPEPTEDVEGKAEKPTFTPTSWLNDRVIRGPWSYPQIQSIAKDYPPPRPSSTPSKPQPKPLRQS